MIRLGYCGLISADDMHDDFVLEKYNVSNTYVHDKSSNAKYNTLSVYNGVYDLAYFDNDSNITFDNTVDGLPSEWGATTALFAKFNGDLNAGNLDFSLENLNYILISKRELGTSNNLVFKPVCVIHADDFAKNNGATIYDRLVGYGKEYEYKATPVLRDGTEAASFFAVYDGDKIVKWSGHYIFDGISEWHCNIETSLNWTRNKPGSIVNPLNTKYPYRVTVCQNNYDTITIRGTHMKVDCSKPVPFDIEANGIYNQSYDDFITNNRSKLIRDWTGRMWIAELDGNVEHNSNGRYCNIDTQHSFVEIADYTSEKDLYKYGFSNYNPDVMSQDSIEGEVMYGATILVTLTDYEGNRIPNRNITLLCNNIEVWKTTANSNGQAVVTNLDAGLYTIVVGSGANATKRYFGINTSSPDTIPVDVKVGA